MLVTSQSRRDCSGPGSNISGKLTECIPPKEKLCSTPPNQKFI